jgi:hypothetical protein
MEHLNFFVIPPARSVSSFASVLSLSPLFEKIIADITSNTGIFPINVQRFGDWWLLIGCVALFWKQDHDSLDIYHQLARSPRASV